MTLTDSELIVDKIKDLYSKGVMDKTSVKRVVRAYIPMEESEFEAYHVEAMRQMVENTNLSQEEKRARALMRLSYIQSKLLEDVNFNPRSLLEVERMRMAVEGTESPKETHQTFKIDHGGITTKEEADAYFRSVGMISQPYYSDEEVVDADFEEKEEPEVKFLGIKTNETP